MNKWFIAITGFLATTFILSTVSLAEHDKENEALVVESKRAIKGFATRLQERLKAGLAEGGPVNAISICNHDAPEIALALSDEHGFRVARTSLKTRNPGNDPDSWEFEVLRQFEGRKAAGEPLSDLEHSAIVEDRGRRTFRFMKAIPTKPVCLTCHGSDIKPAVVEALDALYPDDQARGFVAGDIRGAFTIEIEMK